MLHHLRLRNRAWAPLYDGLYRSHQAHTLTSGRRHDATSSRCYILLRHRLAATARYSLAAARTLVSENIFTRLFFNGFITPVSPPFSQPMMFADVDAMPHFAAFTLMPE